MPRDEFYNLDTDNTLSANSDVYVPSQKAVKEYVGNNLPIVNDAVLTIQQNGTTMATFSANASTNTTLDMSTTVVKFRDWSDN